MKEIKFPAPSEELELKLVDFCLNKLNLKLGEFWYQWFQAASFDKTGNSMIVIQTNHNHLLGTIKDKIGNAFDIEKIHSVKLLDISNWVMYNEDFKLNYRIHVKFKNYED